LKKKIKIILNAINNIVIAHDVKQPTHDQGNDAGFAKTIKDERVFGPATALGPCRYEPTKLNTTRDPVVLGREVMILSG
jgi:hypothetical protein